MLNPIELPKASNKIQSELVHSLLLKGFWDTSKEHHHTAWSYMLLLLIFKVTLKPIGHLVQMIVEALVDIVYSLVPTWFHGPPTKKKVVSRGSAESEYQALASLTIEIVWDPIYLERTLHSSSTSLVWLQIPSFMPAPNILNQTSILFVTRCFNKILSFSTFPPPIK